MTACSICSDMKMASVTSAYIAVPGVGEAAPGGVAPGHWGGGGTRWSGPRGASAVKASAEPGLTSADRVGPGVAGAIMAGPGGSGVVPQRVRTETEIWEAGDIRSGSGVNTGSRASRIAGAWMSSASGAGLNGAARALIVGGTGTCAQGTSGGTGGLVEAYARDFGF